MDIVDLLITKNIAEKLARKHDVEAYEVYEVFWNEEDVVRIFRSPRGSGTYIALGRTEAGRYLAVPFVPKRKIAHILTARNMTERERKHYRER